MQSRKPNRYNAARDAHDAAMRNPHRPTPARRNNGSPRDPAMTLLKALVFATIVAVTLSAIGII